jgi:hypothetical protein
VDALADLAPVAGRYATLPVAQAFDWAACADRMPSGEWYLVGFRSLRAPSADEARLAAYDDAAHAEAVTAKGFTHYAKGPTAPDGSCLSFCLWSSRATARAASSGAAHLAAVTLVREMYADYRLEFLRLRKRAAGAPLEFEPYDLEPNDVEPRSPLAPRLVPNVAPA